MRADGTRTRDLSISMEVALIYATENLNPGNNRNRVFNAEVSDRYATGISHFHVIFHDPANDISNRSVFCLRYFADRIVTLLRESHKDHRGLADLRLLFHAWQM